MPRLIETASLLVLFAVVILRPLVGESYDSAGSPFTAALQAVDDPSPLRTLTFNLLILLAACGWLVVRAVGPPRRYRPTGLEWGAGVVAVAMVVSCLFAGNKRVAVNASIDWLCYPLLAITLVQLLYRPWHRRLLLAAVLASACVQAVHCCEQYFVGFDETWAHYQAIKEDFWANQGVDLDSTKVDAFERRILSREATGFMPHSSVTGSYLVLCGMAGMGLSIARWKGAWIGKSRLGAIAAALCTLLILSAVFLTNSFGALIAGSCGLALWVVVVLLRRWFHLHRTKAVFIGWGCVAIGALAMTGYGLWRNALPSWSLTFRWQWWRASSRLIGDYWLTGVGRENFGRHYLRYKLIESPEEVANPHNLLVQAAADWGVLGLVGLVLMLVGASWAVMKPLGTAASRPELPTDQSRAPPTPLLWAVALVLVVTIGRLPLLGTDNPDFLYYATVTTGLVWLLGFLISAGWWARDELSVDASSRMLCTGVAIGLFTFVLHDMINFAAFVPGAATTLFALFAFCVAERSQDIQPAAAHVRPRWRLPLAALTAGLVIIVYVAVVPVARAALHLGRARQAGRQLVPAPITAQLAHESYLRAIDADPIDPTPCVEHARWLMSAASLPDFRADALHLADAALQKAARRNPFGVSLRRLQMQLHRSRAEETGSTEDYQAAVDAAQKVIELYPRGPAGYVDLADRQVEMARVTDSTKLLHRAIENYRYALTLDSQRLWWEELHRFTDKEQEAIKSNIDRIRTELEERSP